MVADDDKAQDDVHEADAGNRPDPKLSSAARGGAPKGQGDPHVSNALRTAYQATVQEEVPPEFLDLLGKLA